MFSRSLTPSISLNSTKAVQLCSKSSSLFLSRESTRMVYSSPASCFVRRQNVVCYEHRFSHEAQTIGKKVDDALHCCIDAELSRRSLRQAIAEKPLPIGIALTSHQSFPSSTSTYDQGRSPRAPFFRTAAKAFQSKAFKKSDKFRRVCRSLLLVATLSLCDMSILDNVAYAAIPGGRYYVAAASTEILAEPVTTLKVAGLTSKDTVISKGNYDLSGTMLPSPPIILEAGSNAPKADNSSLQPQKMLAASLDVPLQQKHGRIHSHKSRAVTYRQLGRRLGGLPWWQEQQRLREIERREFWTCNDSASYVASCQSSPAVASLPHTDSGFTSWIDEQMDHMFPGLVPWDVRPSHAIPMAAAVAASPHDGLSSGLFRNETSPLAIARGRNVATSSSSAIAAAVSRGAGSASVAAASAGMVIGEQGVAAAGAMAMAGTNASVFRASMAATMKLASISAFIVWLQKSKILPAATPTVLSQVAFRLFIPCFMMSKVATTLSSQSISELAGLPLVALLQVASGAVLGKLAIYLAYDLLPRLQQAAGAASPPFSLSSLLAALTLPSSPHTSSEMEKDVCRSPMEGGKQPTPDTPSFSALSSDVPAPGAPAASVPAPPGIDPRTEALITAACAFGNSMTLPLVFLTALLSPAEADRAAGFLALFMVGWNPALWTIGYNILATGGEGETAAGEGDGNSASTGGQLKNFFGGLSKALNPPIYGVLAGLVIGATPLGHFFLPPSSPSALLPPSAALPFDPLLTPVAGVNGMGLGASLATAATAVQDFIFGPLTAGVLHPLIEAAAILGSACVAVQAVVLSSSLADSVPSWEEIRLALPKLPNSSLSLPLGLGGPVLPPPTNSTATATATAAAAASLAAVPLNSNTLQSAAPAATAAATVENSAAPYPMAMASSAMLTAEGAAAFASFPAAAAASLSPTSSAMATAVLAATQPAAALSGAREGGGADGDEVPSAAAAVMLLDDKALWVVCLVRLLFMPIAGMAGVMALYQSGMIPHDPICALCLLVQAAMPSAQNLVLLSQLNPATRPVAGALASLMFKQYAIAMLPVTLWITLFLSVLQQQ